MTVCTVTDNHHKIMRYTYIVAERLAMWQQQMKNGRWQFFESYKDWMTGTRKVVSVTFSKNTTNTRRMAHEALQRKLDEAKRYEVNYPSITVHELFEKYAEMSSSWMKDTTRKRNITSLKTTEKIIGSKTKVDKLNAHYINQAFIDYGESPTTCNERLKVFKSVLRWANKNELIKDVSYIPNITIYKDDRRSRIKDKYLEKSELIALLNAMKVEKWKTFTAFLCLSGLRIGEAIALLENDVDIENKTIYVNKTYIIGSDIIHSTKTESSDREVYMQHELLELCKAVKPNVFFFSDDGNPIKYYAYNKYLKETTKKVIGRALSPHALRHTHVSLLAEAGIPLDAIGRRIGHGQNSNVTRDVYLHVTNEVKKRELAMLDNVKLT